MTECPKSSKPPEKLAFLEFYLHTVEITFSILFYFFAIWEGEGGEMGRRVFVLYLDVNCCRVSLFFVFTYHHPSFHHSQNRDEWGDCSNTQTGPADVNGGERRTKRRRKTRKGATKTTEYYR